MFWIDRDRTPVRGNCGVQPVVRLEYDAQVAAPIRFIRHERDTPLDEREGFVVPPLLMREHACVVQGSGMIGYGLEHPAVHFVGLRTSSGGECEKTENLAAAASSFDHLL